jgi:peroxiredoxin Q/BCP
MAFPFDLLSDEEEKVCTLFGVMKMKNMYGRQVRGIERSTFVIGPDGKIKAIFRKVKPDQHVELLLGALS